MAAVISSSLPIDQLLDGENCMAWCLAEHASRRLVEIACGLGVGSSIERRQSVGMLARFDLQYDDTVQSH